MRIVGEIAVDGRLFRDMVKAQMGRMLRTLRLLGVLVAVLAALLWLLRPASATTIAITVAAPVSLLTPELVVYLSRRQLAPLLSEPCVYEVTEKSVSVSNSLLRQQFDWDSFVAIEQTPEMWVLRHRVPSLVLTVVKAAFTPADQAEIEHLLASRGLVPA